MDKKAATIFLINGRSKYGRLQKQEKPIRIMTEVITARYQLTRH